MRRFLFLLFAMGASVMAQENWAFARLLCQTETHYRIEVQAIGETDTVMIVPEIEGGITWHVGDEKTQQLEVSLENTYLNLVISAWGGSFYGDTLMLSPVTSCDYHDNNAALESMIREFLIDHLPQRGD